MMRLYKLNKSLLEGINSFEDYINRYWKDSEGNFLPGNVVNGLQEIREQIARDLPEFTIEELIKYNAYRRKIDELYKFMDVEDLFIGLEVEEVLKNKAEKLIDKNNVLNYKPFERWYRYFVTYKGIKNQQIIEGYCVYELKNRLNSKEMVSGIVKDIETDNIQNVAIRGFELMEIIPKGWATKLLTKIGIWHKY